MGCSMAYTHRNLAYDIYLFEEPETSSARSKKNGERSADEKSATSGKQNTASKRARSKDKTAKKSTRRKGNLPKIIAGVVFGVAVLAVVLSIIHGQVQLTELNQQIIDAKADLAEKQSVYTQLEMKVDSSISTSVVEQYAKEKLAMSKASNSQKEFISLSRGDKAEVTMNENKNIFQLIADAVSSLWS